MNTLRILTKAVIFLFALLFMYSHINAQSKDDAIIFDLSDNGSNQRIGSSNIGGIERFLVFKNEDQAAGKYKLKIERSTNSVLDYKINNESYRNGTIHKSEWAFDSLIVIDIAINDTLDRLAVINISKPNDKKGDDGSCNSIFFYTKRKSHQNCKDGYIYFDFLKAADTNSFCDPYEGAEHSLTSTVGDPTIKYFRKSDNKAFNCVEPRDSYVIVRYGFNGGAVALHGIDMKDESDLVAPPITTSGNNFEKSCKTSSKTLRINSSDNYSWKVTGPFYSKTKSNSQSFTFDDTFRPGMYTVKIERTCCPDDVSRTVEFEVLNDCCTVAPAVTISPSPGSTSLEEGYTICGNESLSVNLSIGENYGYINYFWSFTPHPGKTNTASLPNGSSQTLREAGVYRYTVSNRCGNTSGNINVYKCCDNVAPTFTTAPVNRTFEYCELSDDPFTLSVIPTSAGEYTTIEWFYKTSSTASPTRLEQTGFSITDTREGQYLFQLDNGCRSTGTRTFTVNEAVGCGDPVIVTENSAELCQDGKDNDGDGIIDCEDEDCYPFFICEPNIECTVVEIVDGKIINSNSILFGFELEGSSQTFGEKLNLFGTNEEEFFQSFSDVDYLPYQIVDTLFGREYVEEFELDIRDLSFEKSDWRSIVETTLPLHKDIAIFNGISEVNSEIDVSNGQCSISILGDETCDLSISITENFCNHSLDDYSVSVADGKLPIKVSISVYKPNREIRYINEFSIINNVQRTFVLPNYGDEVIGIIVNATDDLGCMYNAESRMVITPECIPVTSANPKFRLDDMIDFDCLKVGDNACVTLIDKATNVVYNDIEDVFFEDDKSYELIITRSGIELHRRLITFCTDPDNDGIPYEDCNIDSDGDGIVDCQDNILNDPIEDCTNGVDNDGDGFLPCRDLDCFEEYLTNQLLSSIKKSANCPVGNMLADEEVLEQLLAVVEDDLENGELSDYFGSYVQRLDELFQSCSSSNWAPYKDGMVPFCLWEDSPQNIAFGAGMVDGVFISAKDLYNFARNIEDTAAAASKVMTAAVVHFYIPYLCADYDSDERLNVFNKIIERIKTKAGQSARMYLEKADVDLTYLDEACDLGNTLGQKLDELIDFLTSWDEIKMAFSNAIDKITEFFAELAAGNNIAYYSTGKITSQLLLEFLGPGVVAKAGPKLAKAAKSFASFSTAKVKSTAILVKFITELRLYKFDADVKRLPDPENDNIIQISDTQGRSADHIYVIGENPIFKIYKGRALKMLDANNLNKLTDIKPTNAGTIPKADISKHAMRMDMNEALKDGFDDDFLSDRVRAIKNKEDAKVPDPNSRTSINSTIENTRRPGTLSEELAVRVFKDAGYDFFDAKLPGNRGIDALMIKRGPDNRITDVNGLEAKQITNSSITLPTTGTGAGRHQQASYGWFRDRLEKYIAHPSTDAADVAQAQNIFDFVDMNQAIDRFVVGLDRKSVELVIMKIE